jgi:uncharacterized membrane protein
MNSVYWHLAINHVPVLGVMFGTVILILALARRQKDVWRVGLAMLALSGFVAIFAYRTGEAAEEIVEEDAAISHDAIEAHEDAGKRAAWLTGLAGAAALVGLVAFRARPTPAWFKILMVTAALASSLMMGLTANLGAAIEHAEHMGGAPPAEHEAEEP